MKFKVQRDLLAEMVSCVSGIVIKGKDPGETGQYIRLNAETDGLSAAVVRNDLAAKVSVSSSAMGGGLMSIENPGAHTFGGEWLIKGIESKKGDFLMVSFKENPEVAKSVSKDEDGKGIPKVLGSAVFSLPEIRGRAGKFTLPSIDMVSDPKLTSASDTVAVVAGADFISLIKQVSMAVGQSNMDQQHSIVLVRVNGEVAELATFNGQQLAWAKFKTIESKKPFSCTVPYDLLLSVAKMCSPEGNIELALTGGNMPKLTVSQPFNYGGENIGNIVARINTSSQEFPSFEKNLESISFKYECKIRAEEIRRKVLNSPVQTIRMRLSFLPKDKLIDFIKTDKNAGVSDEDSLDIEESKGGDLTLEVSARHFTVAVETGQPGEYLDLKFSGKGSKAMFQISPQLKMYFQPFSGDE